MIHVIAQAGWEPMPTQSSLVESAHAACKVFRPLIGSEQVIARPARSLHH